MSAAGAQKIRVAAVGAGYWGKNIIRNLASLGVLSIICERDPDTLGACKVQYPRVECVRRLNEVLNNKEIDALFIATPAETHYDLVKKGLNADKHIFVEKPLSLDSASGKELVDLANERNLILMVGHLLHYHPAVRKLKDLINQGDLGRLQYIYSNRLNLGRIRTEENILWSFAPHDISLILSIIGQMPSRITALGSNFLNMSIADTTISTFSFSKGISAHIFVSWLHPFKEQKLVIVGDRSMAVFNDMEPEEKLLLFPHQVRWKYGMPVPDKKEAIPIKCDKLEPLEEECKHFLECIEQGSSPMTDGEEGLKVLKVLTACQRSMRNHGQVVELEPAGQSESDCMVHETALLDKGVKIGSGTEILGHSHLMAGSEVGQKCAIGDNVVIGPGVKVGNGCNVLHSASIAEGAVLEDDVFCGPSAVFSNVMNPRSAMGRSKDAPPTLAKQGATIGAGAIIECGNTLGRYCFVEAGAIVGKDVPDHALVVGNPARQTGWICRCGQKLQENSEGDFICPGCEDQYAAGATGLFLKSD